MTKIVLPDNLNAPAAPVDAPFGMAFIEPGTACEKAWADLCDERENADVDRIVAATGGWDEWAKAPVTYRAFTAAFSGDASLLTAEREGRE
jgi:hypothetical protein